jgi:hypothetical protein
MLMLMSMVLRLNSDYLTKFALMGEKLDSKSPETSTTIEGDLIEDTTIPTYRLPVKITLSATDLPIETSLGVENTFYKVNMLDWGKYIAPIEIGETGEYTLKFFSVDRDHNSELSKEYHFKIMNEKQPEIKIRYDNPKKSYLITDTDGNMPKSIMNEDENTILTFINGSKNTTLTIRQKGEQNKSDIQLISLKYNYEPPIYFSSSMFATKLKGPDLQWQMYNVEDTSHIKIEYSDKNKRSIIKEDDKKPISLEGIKTIILETNKGFINYHLE